MKKINLIYSKIIPLLGLILILNSGCERDLSDEVEFATLDKTGEIFLDAPIGLGSDFYFPFSGSKPTAWTVDENEGYNSKASMRIDVPNANDPEGNYAGAIFRVDGSGRNLTEYDALTFWAKASQGVTIGEIGFGQDFIENKHQVSISNLSLSTNWVKYIIPIPDASKLFNERGMFWYSAGTQNTNGYGYTFWIDELQFEKLGTIGQPRPKIYDGQDIEIQSFIGTDGFVELPKVTLNLASGQNVTVNAAHSYFNWTSSNQNIVTIDETGFFITHTPGKAVISATAAGVQAEGTLTVNVLGEFKFAPTPTRDPSKVISIFSDVYNNVPVDFFNGYWEPFQTTQSADFTINGDNILNYTNFNFVGNQFANPTIDATEKSNLHINMFIPGEIPSNLDFLITLVDFGADGVEGGNDDLRQQVFFNGSHFQADTWSTLEIPITLANRSKMGLIIYENINGSSLTNFYLDNIYFYSE
jgi:hypothetical protein